MHSIPLLSGAKNVSVPNVNVYSPRPNASVRVPVVQPTPNLNLSPEKEDGPTLGFQYIFGEITNGGRMSITGKVFELEKDCLLA